MPDVTTPRKAEASFIEIVFTELLVLHIVLAGQCCLRWEASFPASSVHSIQSQGPVLSSERRGFVHGLL